ncbi:MAG: alanine racemase [Streptosporangiaceae bacterium]
MSHPTRALIELGAIRGNVALVRERAGVAVMAMVKAEGYGHGAVRAARAAVEGGAAWLGVAFVHEALELRRAGLEVPVLVGVTGLGDPFDEAVEQGIDLGVGAMWVLRELERAAERTGRTARVQLKADTGMTRGGATAEQWPVLVEAALKAEASGRVTVTGLWSHLACADEPTHPSVRGQVRAFAAAVEFAERAGVRPEVRHLANSAAALTLPEARYDLVRPGIATYGLSPVPEFGDFGLRPAMTLTSTVALAKRVGAGHGVSYGHAYVTSGETTVALVPAGYADGIPRNGSNVLELLAAGRRRRIAGRVCMDQFMIDLGDDAIEVGDEAVLFGPGDGGEPTAQDWAEATGTISYEIVTRIGSRVPRVYSE